MPNFMTELAEKIHRIEFRDGEADLAAMYELVERISTTKGGRALIPNLFQFFEANADKEVGNPGPFVHFIEEESDYHAVLVESLDRKPTCITLWMVNRLLNGISELRERETWMDRLRAAQTHPAADERARKAARDFLRYQKKRAT